MKRRCEFHRLWFLLAEPHVRRLRSHPPRVGQARPQPGPAPGPVGGPGEDEADAADGGGRPLDDGVHALLLRPGQVETDPPGLPETARSDPEAEIRSCFEVRAPQRSSGSGRRFQFKSKLGRFFTFYSSKDLTKILLQNVQSFKCFKFKYKKGEFLFVLASQFRDLKIKVLSDENETTLKTFEQKNLVKTICL